MSRGCHVPGLVTEQSHCREATWSLSSAVLFTIRLAGGDVDG